METLRRLYAFTMDFFSHFFHHNYYKKANKTKRVTRSSYEIFFFVILGKFKFNFLFVFQNSQLKKHFGLI